MARAAIDSVFSDLLQAGKADWAIAQLGYSGLPTGERLGEHSVRSFASGEVEQRTVDDPVFTLALDLATDASLSVADMHDKLAAACEASGGDTAQARLTWQLAMLGKRLEQIDADPVYGLIDLHEFWTAWDWPDDRPPSMKSCAEVGPDVYHTAQHLAAVVDDHRRWLEAARKR